MKESGSSRLGWTGAEAILAPSLMLSDQEKYLRRILLHIYDLAIREAELEQKEGATYYAKQIGRRPHQVFLIDGARGSGKTTLLLSIQQYLRYLGRPRKWTSSPKSIPQEFLEGFAKDVNRKLANQDPPIPPLIDRFQAAHSLGNGKQRQTSYFLPVLFPSDLEFGQSIMEGVLALLAETLEDEIERLKKKGGSEEKRRISTAEKLRDDIHQKVAAGWFLSRNTGTDAILRDSMNYDEFVLNRGKANVQGFSRVVTWRRYLNDYLDFFESELLVVFFDDTDVATSVSKDILHTIRIFLDHPRIVTVIAGNLHSIRQSLILDEMKTLGPSIEALANQSEATARDWRKYLRNEVEESLEKVLPRRFRFFITTAQDQNPMDLDRPGDTGDARGRPSDASNSRDVSGTGHQQAKKSRSRNGEDADFRRIFHMSFDELCGEMLNYWRRDYIWMRQQAHFRWLEDRQEIWREDEVNKLEHYASWWLLRHSYATRLRPRTVRHMAALRAYVMLKNPNEKAPKSDFAVDNLRSEHKKRLAVILYESPENFELIHRLNDADRRVLSWLHRQNITSSWRGDRFVEINGNRIYENTYSYYFLLYRLDLGIAIPVQENPDETLPQGLLPVPDGPNLIKYQPFFPRNRRQRTYGVAKALDHTTIPANCIFLCDADCLPDAAWHPTQNQQQTPWERRLVYDQQRIFFFDLEEMKSRTERPRPTSKYQPTPSGTDDPKPDAPGIQPSAAEPTLSPDSELTPSGAGYAEPIVQSIPHLATEPPPLPNFQPMPSSAENAKPSAQAAQPSTAELTPPRAELSTDCADDPKFLQPTSDEINEQWVSEYFIRSVIPAAGMIVGQFTRPRAEFGDRSQTVDQVAKNSLLRDELMRSDHPFFEGTIENVEHLLRRYDYLQSIAQGAIASGATPVAQEAFLRWRDLILDTVFPVQTIGGSATEMQTLADRLRGYPPAPKPVPGRETDEADERVRFVGQIDSYRWLVNDVRRGWQAARIFLNQISGALKKYSSMENPVDTDPAQSDPMDAAPEITRKDRFFREDRYTLGTRMSLHRWMDRSTSLRTFITDYKQKATLEELGLRRPNKGFWTLDPNYVERQMREDFGKILWRKFGETPSWAGNFERVELNAQQLGTLLQARAGDEEKGGERRIFYFDPMLGSSKDDDPVEVLQAQTHSRLARSLLLFLFGFAPTLPSLIHLEVAAVMKHFPAQDPQQKIKKASAVLQAWCNEIRHFMTFIYDYRRLLELMKFRLDIMELCRQAYDGDGGDVLKVMGIKSPLDPISYGVWLALTPDMSFATLGIGGIRTFTWPQNPNAWPKKPKGTVDPDLQFSPELTKLQTIWTRKNERWKETENKTGRVVWQSMIEDTYDNLIQAQNFIVTMRRVLCIDEYSGEAKL